MARVFLSYFRKFISSLLMRVGAKHQIELLTGTKVSANMAQLTMDPKPIGDFVDAVGKFFPECLPASDVWIHAVCLSMSIGDRLVQYDDLSLLAYRKSMVAFMPTIFPQRDAANEYSKIVLCLFGADKKKRGDTTWTESYQAGYVFAELCWDRYKNGSPGGCPQFVLLQECASKFFDLESHRIRIEHRRFLALHEEEDVQQ